MSYILVIGSSNTDMVIGAPHLPAPGETIIGQNFFMNPGGKGANQAVAAARLGGTVKFICKTGNDVFGEKAVEGFRKEGIDTSALITDPDYPSGLALITVDENGENTIVVASGANGNLTAEDLQQNETLIAQASLVLMQLEIPFTSVEFAATVAHKYGVPVILNPAPAAQLSPSLLSLVSIITPNETEASMLTGIKVDDINTARKAAAAINKMGVRTVIITMGQEGVCILHDEIFTHVPASKVKARDTTAAGDIFNGAFSVAFYEGKDIVEAAKFACSAATISVTRMGAQSSAPYRHELNEPLQNNL